MFKHTMMAAALALATASAAAPAAGQTQRGLVNVAVGDVTVLQDFLNDSEIEILTDLLNENQVIVQVPIGVAANACNIQANVLARAGAPGGECTAQNGSRALAQAIRRQHLRNR